MREKQENKQNIFTDTVFKRIRRRVKTEEDRRVQRSTLERALLGEVLSDVINR